jgi:exopolysaccharide biosynthesis polyprenyl glycosylphosphotransferase
MQRRTGSFMNVGVLVLLATVSKIHASLIATPSYPYPRTTELGAAVAYGALLALSLYAFGMPDAPPTKTGAALAAAGAVLTAGLAVSAVGLLSGHSLLPRFVVLGAAGLVAAWSLVCWELATSQRARARERDRVVLVGAGTDAAELSAELGANPERPAIIAGTLDPAANGSVGPASLPLVGVAKEANATTIVLTRDALSDESIVRQASILHNRGCRVRSLPGFYQEWLGKVPVADLEATSLLFDVGGVHLPAYVRAKRLADIVLSIAGAAVLFIVLPFVVVGDLLGNRGPLLYRQDRVGRNGTVFSMLKFRTMKPAGEDAGSEWTQPDDSRITPFGRLLRTMHLDEFPQVINVLRGDLSIVGPRPEQPRYVEELRDKLPFYDFRHLVRPGLTGWAQVKYGYGSDHVDAFEKLQYDFYYLQNQALSLDLRIVTRTLRSIMRGSGR